jgi:ferritin-like metal-binding protein YciE
MTNLAESHSVQLPPQVESLHDLLLRELAKLLTIEEMLAKVMLPKLQLEVQDEELKQAVNEHLEQTRMHVEHVKSAFASLGAQPKGEDAAGLDGLKKERE